MRNNHTSKQNTNNKAFTLVELAIVIVIIGLIVGGVIGGQSLIESARINSIISDSDKYKTALNAFKLEYNGMPGDMRDATDYWGQAGDGSASQCRTVSGTGTQTCNGDGDKIIDFSHPSFSDSPHEPWRIWQHLSNAEIIAGEYSGISGTGCSITNYCTEPGINSPESKIPGASWHIFIISAGNTSWGGKPDTRNTLVLGNPKNNSGNGVAGVWYGLALTTKQQHRIDKKIDDGIANFGSITNMNPKTTVGTYNPNCTTLSSGVLSYNLSYTDLACNLLIDLD